MPSVFAQVYTNLGALSFGEFEGGLNQHKSEG